MIDPLLLAIVPIETVRPDGTRTNATGFFFQREDALFLVTNRHVVLDEATGHVPEALEIDVHTNADNLVETERITVPLYASDPDAGEPVWRSATDSAGTVDIVAIPLDRQALPASLVYEPFTPWHLADFTQPIEVGTSLVIVGFPLGFRDSLHHLPVARQAVVASAFGMRFEGQGYFLTDSRLHRGTSGSPVVLRLPDDAISDERLPWRLLGVHASRIDLTSRDVDQDEHLGLNCAWYTDVLMVLTEPVVHSTPDAAPSGVVVDLQQR